MLRKLNRIVQNFLRKKRLEIGKKIWDRKEKKQEIIKEDFLKNNNIKSILFLRYDGKIGDTVVNTLLFREIKKVYKDIKIGVVARKSNAQILENNIYVDNVYIYEKNKSKIKKLAKEIANEKYDLLIDFSDMLRVNQMMFINKCNCKYNIGFNKDNWELFDLSFDEPKGNYHISELYQHLLGILGIKSNNLDYDMNFSVEDKLAVDEILKENKGKKIFILNPFAASKHRELSEESICKIIDIILRKENTMVFLIGENSKEKQVQDILKKYSKNVSYAKLNNIREVAYLIKKSDFVITPDTSIVHIAACFKKNMIAIYRMSKDEENEKNSNLWGPNYENAHQIFSFDDEVKFGDEPDINKFNIKEIENILENI